MCGWSDWLLFHGLCWNLLEITLVPNQPVSRLFCGWDHVWKKRLSFIPRAVLSCARHHAIPNAGVFKAFFVAWIMCGRSDCLSFQGLCFHLLETTLLPNQPVSRRFCGLDHVWEKQLFFVSKGCASICSRPRYCQTHKFQAYFMAWIMCGRRDRLSFQKP